MEKININKVIILKFINNIRVMGDGDVASAAVSTITMLYLLMMMMMILMIRGSINHKLEQITTSNVVHGHQMYFIFAHIHSGGVRCCCYGERIIHSHIRSA